MNWKSKKHLCVNQYRNVLLDYISLEKMDVSSMNQLDQFVSLWSPLIYSIT